MDLSDARILSGTEAALERTADLWRGLQVSETLSPIIGAEHYQRTEDSRSNLASERTMECAGQRVVRSKVPICSTNSAAMTCYSRGLGFMRFPLRYEENAPWIMICVRFLLARDVKSPFSIECFQRSRLEYADVRIVVTTAVIARRSEDPMGNVYFYLKFDSHWIMIRNKKTPGGDSRNFLSVVG